MTNQINNQTLIPSTDVIQLTLTLKLTAAQVVEMSVTVSNNSVWDYNHPDNHAPPTYKVTTIAMQSNLLIVNLSTVL